ncbi:MAG: hypothetical protein HWN71_01990 [Desulfobacterales bacterium]|nr:hypothetical protein [Desulfobacterales bacterium]
MVKVRVGCSIKSLLCHQLGLSPEYLEGRIQTILLDGRPVDDVESAIVKQGSILALSAALPGLVGATLRRGGYYAPLRSHISHSEAASSQPIQEGMISLKLFNLPLDELGSTFLKKGIWINGRDLADFLKRQPDAFWSRCKGATVDGKKFDLDKLAKMKWPDRHVFLRVRTC